MEFLLQVSKISSFPFTIFLHRFDSESFGKRKNLVSLRQDILYLKNTDGINLISAVNLKKKKKAKNKTFVFP